MLYSTCYFPKLQQTYHSQLAKSFTQILLDWAIVDPIAVGRNSLQENTMYFLC